ncbi:beta-galactosidase [Glycomyces arizonensis]|uniref:beta-galactosidase n=1 Tax=Glycomyces arizonensis TaxID=256035 RepID=UPI000410EE6C|nr:beta-galactosidase [Glycomyces arizonensis]
MHDETSAAHRTRPRPTARALRCPPPGPVARGRLPLGEPPGSPDRIEVTGRWIERGGAPWFPVSGEVHYSRIPRERWAETLGHARAGGLDTVATYVFWRSHEPEPGRFDWDGGLDLRAFVELAAAHGLDAVVRMGPWAHGEARHGGFPDWLVERDVKTRTDDPAYLELVRAFYAETIDRLGGLTHAEGGPVVAVQVDNELYDQPGHLATLRAIAEDLGLRVPIWTATGWGGAQVPGTLLPVYGAYTDGFWEEADTEWPAFAPVHFRYSEVRDDLSVGADLREGIDGIEADTAAEPEKDALPFATCELGGGMHVAYHRRPLVAPEDVAAMALAKIGSGSVWQGYYMYAGGTQRTGAAGGEQESHATGYPNDVPRLTYDFGAPIGEHGQIRPHHHLLRRQHLWLAEDGRRLAAMPAFIGGGDDPDELRWAVRSDGRSGYLFATTYQPPKRPLGAQRGVQFTIGLEGGDVTVPTAPIDLPAGVSLAWPLRYPLAPGLELRSATAQVLTRVADEEGDIVVLAATDGVPVEIVLGDGTVVDLPAEPGPECLVRLPGARLLVLDEASANRLYKLDVAGRERLVLADVPVYAEGGELVAHPDTERWTVALLPAPERLAGDPGELRGPWRTWAFTSPNAGPLTLAEDLRPEHGDPPPPRRGGPMDRLSAPEDYAGAAEVRLDVPTGAFEGADRVLLRVDWTGDTGRAHIGDLCISDHFWHGRVWDVDLTPHRDAAADHGVRLELLPWRAETGIWVDPAVRGAADGVTVASVSLVRVGRVRLHAEEAS